MNLAIIIGVDQYKSTTYENLPACKNDSRVISEVLNNVKDVKETLFINKNEAGYEVKRQIADLVEKYKGEKINELFFYFSGHGERYDDDFFYLFSDFDSIKRESTGLRNSEVDNWIKTLSPKLCVKVIDACFSGTQYIKSKSNTEHELKKSAEKYGINDIYFWFSSRENQTSYAGEEFSQFTESILSAILEHHGDVRYREIMASVADDFINKGDSKPIFVTQADNIEKFGNVTKSTHKIIYDAFGIIPADEQDIQPNKANAQKPDKTTNPTKQKEKSSFELIRIQSEKVCFKEEDLLVFIKSFNEYIFEWSEDFSSIYEIESDSEQSIYGIPNTKEIGTWLSKNKNENYFAKPTYLEETYEEEEYKALPEKPRNSLSAAVAALDPWRSKDREYRLETVTKTRSVIEGFEYTHSSKNRIIRIFFKPKVELAPPLNLYIVPIYSNKNMILHIAYESLNRNDWKSFSYPKCKNWKMIQADPCSSNSAKTVASSIQAEIKQWVESLFTSIMK